MKEKLFVPNNRFQILFVVTCVFEQKRRAVKRKRLLSAEGYFDCVKDSR